MIGSVTPLRDFSPDLDPFTPGILLDCDKVYGTMKGIKALPSLTDVTGAVLSNMIGTYSFPMPSGDIIILGGTTSHIYRFIGGAWTLFDGSDSEASVRYGTGLRWRMSAFGSVLLAANGVNSLQVSENSGAFQNVADVLAQGGTLPPVPSIVAATDYGIFLAKANSDQWYFSPNWNDWTPDIATLTTSGSLQSTPGAITAMHRLRDGVAVYKGTSLYYMVFTGPPFIWEPRLVSEQVGCANHEAVVNVGDLHYFLGPDDFYIFDGSSLRKLDNALREWFFDRLSDVDRARVLGRYDRVRSLVFWHYPSTSATDGEPDEWLCYATRSGKWTRGSQAISDTVQPDVPLVTQDMTYETFGATYNTYEDVPDTTYNSKMFYSAENNIPAVINEAGQLQTYTGSAEDAALLTGNIGDGSNYYQLSQIRPVYAEWPDIAKLYPFRIRAAGQPIPDPGPFPYVVDGVQAVLQRDGQFNLISTARIHRLQIETEGDMEITGLMLDLKAVGTQ